jgi:hypothetical protein
MKNNALIYAFVLIVVILLLTCQGCKGAAVATFTPLENDVYEVAISGAGAATYEKDGVKASIDTKRRSMLETLIDAVMLQGLNRN